MTDDQTMIDDVDFPEDLSEDPEDVTPGLTLEDLKARYEKHNTADAETEDQSAAEADEPKVHIPYGNPSVATMEEAERLLAPEPPITPMHETFPTDLDQAAEYFTSRGFALFPVKLTTVEENGEVTLKKKPLCKWADASTTRPSMIVGMLKLRRDRGITEGLALGMDCEKSEIFALDVDVRNGKPGMQSLAALEAKYEPLPRTWVSRTPSGGLHYWFRGHGRNSASSPLLGEALDTRGDGGLIVIPPSIPDVGEPYSWVNSPDGTPLADAPKWLIDLTSEEAEKATDNTTAMITPPPRGDHDGVVTEGSRNVSLFSYLGLRRSQGCGYNELLVLAHVWNQEHCSPPLDEEEVKGRVDSVMRYSPNDARIQRDQNRANVLIVEGLNRLAQDGHVQRLQEQVKHVIPEIVEEEIPAIDWTTYVNEAIAARAVEKIFDESFLAYFLTLYNTDIKAAAALRKRLVDENTQFRLEGLQRGVSSLETTDGT